MGGYGRRWVASVVLSTFRIRDEVVGDSVGVQTEERGGCVGEESERVGVDAAARGLVSVGSAGSSIKTYF